MVEETAHLLSTIFENELLNIDTHTLTEQQQELILCVINKLLSKVQNKLGKSTKKRQIALLKEIKQKSKENDLEWIQIHILNTDRILIRRKEEKLKFIMKNVIKHFRKLYFKEKELKLSRESELQFLNSFYSKHKEIYGLSVENFSDPLNCTTITNPSFKTLTSKYFNQIFSLKEFKDTFFNYLNGDFKTNYQKSVPSKFNKMFGELMNKLDASLHLDEEGIFKEYLEKYKKQKNYKLPWLGKEIDDAISVFKQHVQKYTLSITNEK